MLFSVTKHYNKTVVTTLGEVYYKISRALTAYFLTTIMCFLQIIEKPQDITILGWCPVGSFLPHEEVPL